METATEAVTETAEAIEPAVTPEPETQPEQTAASAAFTQADVDRIVGERLERERAKAAKAQETAAQEAARKALEEQSEFKQLYETERAAREAIEQEKRDLLLSNTRRDIAQKYNIPAKLATRLQGSNAEEIEADAKELMSALPQPKAPSLNGGASGGNPGNPRISDAEIKEMAVRYGVTVESMKAQFT